MEHWARMIFDDLMCAKGDISNDTRSDIKRILKIIEQSDVHYFRSIELEEIATQLAECDDLSDLAELMWKATTSVGFQNFAIFVLSQGSGAWFRSRVCTSFHEDWTKRYLDKGYQYIDPVMLKASSSDGWFLYSELDYSSPVVQHFWADAERYRIGRNGLCFVSTQRNGARVGVSFSTMSSNEKVKKSVRLNGVDLQVLAQIATECFCYSSCGPSLPEDVLTEDELRFLYVLSTSPNPDNALVISSSFGSNKSLQASIRAKLKVQTVFQAVAIAASSDWFSLLPYGPQDVLKSFPALEGLPFDKRQLTGSKGPTWSTDGVLEIGAEENS